MNYCCKINTNCEGPKIIIFANEIQVCLSGKIKFWYFSTVEFFEIIYYKHYSAKIWSGINCRENDIRLVRVLVIWCVWWNNGTYFASTFFWSILTMSALEAFYRFVDNSSLVWSFRYEKLQWVEFYWWSFGLQCEQERNAFFSFNSSSTCRCNSNILKRYFCPVLVQPRTTVRVCLQWAVNSSFFITVLDLLYQHSYYD